MTAMTVTPASTRDLERETLAGAAASIRGSVGRSVPPRRVRLSDRIPHPLPRGLATAQIRRLTRASLTRASVACGLHGKDATGQRGSGSAPMCANFIWRPRASGGPPSQGTAAGGHDQLSGGSAAEGGARGRQPALCGSSRDVKLSSRVGHGRPGREKVEQQLLLLVQSGGRLRSFVSPVGHRSDPAEVLSQPLHHLRRCEGKDHQPGPADGGDERARGLVWPRDLANADVTLIIERGRIPAVV